MIHCADMFNKCDMSVMFVTISGSLRGSTNHLKEKPIEAVLIMKLNEQTALYCREILYHLICD